MSSLDLALLRFMTSAGNVATFDNLHNQCAATITTQKLDYVDCTSNLQRCGSYKGGQVSGDNPM